MVLGILPHHSSIVCLVMLRQHVYIINPITLQKKIFSQKLLIIWHFIWFIQFMLHIYNQFCENLALVSAELVSMSKPLYARCLTLEIQRDPWLNRIRMNQCNHAGIWGK